jgi:hypothetical protein
MINPEIDLDLTRNVDDGLQQLLMLVQTFCLYTKYRVEV